MIKLASVSNKICKNITMIGGIFLTINVLLVIVNIIMRRVFNAPIFGSTEYVQYISLIAGSFGLCQNEWYGGNVTMTMLQEKLSERTADWVRFICSSVSSVMFCYVSYLMINDSVAKYVKQDVTNTLAMPKWIFVAILAFGIVCLTLAIIVKTIILGYTAKTGTKINLRDPESVGADEGVLE